MIRRWGPAAAFALLSAYAFWRFGDWTLGTMLALNVPLNWPRRGADS